MTSTLNTLTFLIAALFLIAAIIMSIDPQKSIKNLGMRLWILHVAIYWSALALSILFYDKILYPHYVNIWSSILFLQAAFSIIGAVIAKNRWLR